MGKGMTGRRVRGKARKCPRGVGNECMTKDKECLERQAYCDYLKPMLSNTRQTLVLGVELNPNPAPDHPTTGRRQLRPSPPPHRSIRYDGIKPPGRIPWTALVLSASLHSALILGFNRHVPKAKVVHHEEVVEQMQMMPEVKDDEEDKPKELDDLDTPDTPSVSVPMLADIPTMVPLQSSFVQLIDQTVPVKPDSNAGQLVQVPTNIHHGRPDAGSMKDLFNISELDRRPEPIVQTQPEYPFEMKRAGVESMVRVGFIVDSRGDVVQPYIVSATHNGFDRAAIEAILKWKFRPGMKNGRKVNTRVEQPLNFTVASDKD